MVLFSSGFCVFFFFWKNRLQAECRKQIAIRGFARRNELVKEMQQLVATVKKNFQEACALEQERKDLEVQIEAKTLCLETAENALDYPSLAEARVKELQETYRSLSTAVAVMGLPDVPTNALSAPSSPKSAMSDYVHLDLGQSTCFFFLSKNE